ncbi:F420H(2):quinone oxidoreductase [Archaeoglobales archaeon ex4484_92]|nr:MAG: F420H(2):quinone oxidoreductase [Archaeoglobales archaeon ex4484_92]
MLVVFVSSLAILFIAYLTAISSKDLIRLLISLELMFASLFLFITPLFLVMPTTAFAVLILAVFTSSCELLVFITAIILTDRKRKSIDIKCASVGGEVE